MAQEIKYPHSKCRRWLPFCFVILVIVGFITCTIYLISVTPLSSRSLQPQQSTLKTRPKPVKYDYDGLKLETAALHDFRSPYVDDPMRHRYEAMAKAPGNRTVKVIMRYNRFLERVNFAVCPYSECRVIVNKSLDVSEADLVLFDHDPWTPHKPPRPLGQTWAFCSWESPYYTRQPAPYEEWKGQFNWTCGYEQDADVFVPYGTLAWRDRDTLLADSQYEAIARGKTRIVAWFASNCREEAGRFRYVQRMKPYLPIHVYGKCGVKSCPLDKYSECLQMLNTTYKFYLSFENSFCNDYATEKLWNMYKDRIHVIPVTRGGFRYDKYLPPGTFIDARNFPSPKQLALHLLSLANDVKRYSAMLKAKDRLLTVTNAFFDWCAVCERLHTSTGTTKTIQDIFKVKRELSSCLRKPTFKKKKSQKRTRQKQPPKDKNNKTKTLNNTIYKTT